MVLQISFSTKPRVVNAINVRAFKFVLIPFVLGQSCATSLLMLRAVGFVTKYFNAALISTRVGFIVLMTIVLHVFDMSGKMRFLFKLFVANQAFEHILFDNNNGVFPPTVLSFALATLFGRPLTSFPIGVWPSRAWTLLLSA